MKTRRSLSHDVRGGTDHVQLLILVVGAFLALAGALALGESAFAKFGQEADAVESLEDWDHDVPAVAAADPVEESGSRSPTPTPAIAVGGTIEVSERGLSRIGEQITARLESEHADRRGVTWNVSTGNQLDGDWIMDSPTTWTRQPPGATDYLYQAMYDAVIATRREMVFSTLAPPDRPYLATMNRGLRDLAARQPPGGEGIDVRVLVGRGDPEEVREALTEGLAEDGPVRVSVATYGELSSWSHAKMIVSDGEHALVGGHNWWADEYNVEHPVHDVSIRVHGPAAGNAVDYFDGLWSYASEEGTVVGNANVHREPATEFETRPGTPIIAVGTQGGISINADATSDAAIYAMIDAAEHDVKIIQQDLVSMKIGVTREQIAEKLHLPKALADRLLPREIVPIEQHLTAGLLDALGNALVRGVTVDIAISTSAEGANGGYSNGWTTEQVRQAILDHVEDMREPPWWAPWRDPRPIDLEAVEGRLTVNGVHTEQGEVTRNHAKVVIVDESVFYVGSQNLYPGGMAEPFWLQLAEFGFIYDDPDKARVFVDTYWDPMWRHARPTR